MINGKIEKETSFVNRYSKNLAMLVGVRALLKLSIFIFFISFSIEVFSQSIVQLHPLVGDTISNSEKVAFYLFPEITDSCFIEGLIFFQDSAFKVNITEKYKDSHIVAIDSTLLKEYNLHIEKLISYYSKLEEPDSIEQQLLLSNALPIQTSPE